MSESISARCLIRLGLLTGICMILVLGCSGTGDPVTPDLEGAYSVPEAGDGTGSDAGRIQSYQPGGILRPEDRRPYVEDEVLVVLNEPLGQPELGMALASWPLQLVKRIPCRWGTVYEMRVTDGTAVRDMVARLRNDPAVRFAEPNHIYYFAETPHWPNDPLWESDDPGNDPRDNIYDQWGPSKIGASIVWNEGNGSEDVVIAVIDTGIQRDHEDLEGNIWINEDEIADNGIDDDGNGYIDDTWGWDMEYDDNEPWDEGFYMYHGTACAGVAAAIQDNEAGLSGVAPGVKVMALRTGFGDTWESEVIEALNYAVANGADIVSMSFGGEEDSEIFEEAMNDAWDDGLGINLIACAQNFDSTDYIYPGAYDSVMCIGATMPFTADGEPRDEKRIVSYEDGYYWGSNYGDWLTVMGFGDLYMTTSGSCSSCYYDGISEDFFGGTSCATPMSAGVMALIHSFYPGETAQWYWDRLQDTADDLDVPGFDIQTGYGRCNALRAIYGSDRYAYQEDPSGFVNLTLPDAQVFDSIHDVPANPFHDTQDLYRFTTVAEGFLVIELDIFTWGQNLDMALFSDEALTELVDESTVINHSDSSREVITLNTLAGEEFFLRVFSPAPGNSTTYGLRVFNTVNDLSVTGESIAGEFIHQKGTVVPFLKLTLEIGYQATLDEVIVYKHGTLPNTRWARARLYADTNSTGVFDDGDELAATELPFARNRVRLADLDLTWTFHAPLVLFVACDISETFVESTVSFGLETYKDVTTEEGIEAHYTDFSIVSDTTVVGTDSDPPVWTTTTGAQVAEPFYASVRLGWNGAVDVLTPPTKYNVYYMETLPFDIYYATKLYDVPVSEGITTDFLTTVSNLPFGIEQHFVVRAEDQVGNEDDNLVVISCTPGEGGDPTNPVILETYLFDFAYDVSLDEDLLVVADFVSGLRIFDRSNPIYLDEVAVWAGDWPLGAVVDGSFSYVVGWEEFFSVDLTTPSMPQTADSVPMWGMYLTKQGEYVYATDFSDLVPVNVSNPYNMIPSPGVTLPFSGYPYDVEAIEGHIYVAHNGTGILSLDSSNPASPFIAGTFGSTDVTGVTATGGVLYAVDWNDGRLYLYDIESDPNDPPLLDSSSDGPGDYGQRVVLVNDYAYVSRGTYGIVVFDVAVPEDIDYVGDLSLPSVTVLATDGIFIYAISSDGTLNVII